MILAGAIPPAWPHGEAAHGQGACLSLTAGPWCVEVPDGLLGQRPIPCRCNVRLIPPAWKRFCG